MPYKAKSVFRFQKYHWGICNTNVDVSRLSADLIFTNEDEQHNF